MQDAIYSGYDGSTFSIVFKLNCPTSRDLEDFSADSKLEIRFVEVDDLIFFSVKLQNMGWQDAPFTPHYYDPKPFTIVPPSDEKLGFVFTLTLINAGTGRQMRTRVVGLGHDFSKRLYDVISSNYVKPFDMRTYFSRIDKIYRRYTSPQLAELCPTNQRYIAGTNPTPTIKLKPEYDGIDMPDEFKQYFCHHDETGAPCVRCIPECLLEKSAGNEDGYTVPIPIKYVMEKGYRMVNGYIVVPAPYNWEYGLVIPDKYYL